MFSSAKKNSVSLHVYVNFFTLEFKGFEAVQKFKYGIKSHQVPNDECVRMFPILFPNLEVRKQYWGFSTMSQIKTKRNTISNKIYKVKVLPARTLIVNKIYYANVKDTIDRLPCFNN
jgi:hypothetical protein